MHRLLRLLPLLTGLGLSFVFGAIACDKVPLLAPTGTIINLTLTSEIAALNSSVDLIAVLIENGQQSGGTGAGTAATGSSTTGAGTPVQNGTVVSFTTTIGSIEPAEARTSNGRVTVKFITGSQSGKATITAYSGGAKSTAQITIGAAAVKLVTASASPQNLPSTGGVSTITARVEDTNGNGLSGVQVVLTTDKGTLASSTPTTNSNGIATTTLSTTSTAKVKATVGAVSSSDLTISVATRATISITGPSGTVAMSTPVSFTINVGTTIPVSNITIDYGDNSSRSLGSFSGSQSVSHFYSSSGIYNVTASATDPDGVVTSSATQVAIVGLSGTLTASVATTTRNVSVLFTVTLAPTGASIDHYSWNFGDGKTINFTTGASQNHVYLNVDVVTVPTTVTVTVTVYPAHGSAFDITMQLPITG